MDIETGLNYTKKWLTKFYLLRKTFTLDIYVLFYSIMQLVFLFILKIYFGLKI